MENIPKQPCFPCDFAEYQKQTCATCKHILVHSEKDGGGANCLLFYDYANPADKACPAWDNGVQ